MISDSAKNGTKAVPVQPAPAATVLTDSIIFQWEKQSFRTDLIFVLPVATCLVIALAVGHPTAGMIAAGGAFTVGFGAKQDIDNSQLLPMIFAALGIAISTFLGMIVGHENFLLVGMAALWGFGCGMLTTREGGYAWVDSNAWCSCWWDRLFPFQSNRRQNALCWCSPAARFRC